MNYEFVKNPAGTSANAAVEVKRARRGMFCGRISCGGAV